MRYGVLILALVALAGCDRVTGASEPDPVFAALVAAEPTFLQVVLVEKGINSGAARETVRDGVTTWRSPDGITLATQDGFLIATRGLGGDMLGSDIRDAMAVVLGGGSGRVTRFHTFLDGENNAVRRAYVCDIRQSGPSEVQLNQQVVPTRLITEDCASQDQQFVNLYWQDRRGQIIQSQQWAGEFTGGLTFRIVP